MSRRRRAPARRRAALASPEQASVLERPTQAASTHQVGHAGRAGAAERGLGEGRAQETLLEALEPDQLFSATSRPLPRRQVSRRLQILLVATRLVLVVLSAMVVVAFVRSVS